MKITTKTGTSTRFSPTDENDSLKTETVLEAFIFYSTLSKLGKIWYQKGIFFFLYYLLFRGGLFFPCSLAKTAFMFLQNHFRFTLPHGGGLLGFGRLRTAGCFLTNGTWDHMFQHLSNFEPEVLFEVFFVETVH